MKTNKRLWITALIAGTLAGAPFSQGANEPKKTMEKTGVKTAENHEKGRSARGMIGQDVLDRAGAKLGELNDIVVDIKSGKAVYAMIGMGGVLGVGETVRAAPFSLLSLSTSNELRLDIENAKWTTAPTVKRADLVDLNKETRGRQIFDHFGVTWDEQMKMTDQKTGAATLAFVTSLAGKDLVNGNQEVGDVEDVIVNLKNRTASALIDPNDNYTGTNEKFVVSFDKIDAAPGNQEKLSTQLTRSDFERATPIEDNYWNSVPEAYIYRWTFIGYPHISAPLAQTAAVSDKARDAAARGTDEQMKTSTGTSQDAAKMVQSALHNDQSLRNAVKNVDVAKQGDHLVLRGTVPSEDLKERIESKAEQIATGWVIKNQITVASGD